MSAVLGQSEPPRAHGRGGARIAVADLRMEYDTRAGRVRALAGITLEIEPGSSVAIVGPSGCGKSTLLGILGGLEQPTSGEVRIDDQVISSMPEKRRADIRRSSFGFVFQADNLQPFLTVSENVSLQAMLAGASDDPDRVHSLLEALEVGSLGHRFPDQLSGGQRQRVAVARALVHGPRVVLADEPTGSLDANSSVRVVELLLRLHRQEGTTLVVVTHDRAVAERMASVIEIRNGHLTAQEAHS